MKNKNIADLRRELNQKSSQQLRELLDRETGKETPDDDLVLTALHILEDRNADQPAELGPKSEAAWKAYQDRIRQREPKPTLQVPRLVKAASLVLVLFGLCLAYLPKQAHAGSFWKIITDWTDDIFQYVNIGEKETEPEEYVFQTDNPGLQQVYDTVVDYLEITEPVVTKWLPEGSELIDISTSETDGKKSVYAKFAIDEGEIILAFNKMEEDRSPYYYKSEDQVEEYEINGVIHSYMRNGSVWSVNWVRHNIKCSIYVDCQEDIVKQIIRSIY